MCVASTRGGEEPQTAFTQLNLESEEEEEASILAKITRASCGNP